MTNDPLILTKNPSSEAPHNEIPLFLFWAMCGDLWGRPRPAVGDLSGVVRLSDAFLYRLCSVYFGDAPVMTRPATPVPLVERDEEEGLPPFVDIRTALDQDFTPATKHAEQLYPKRTKPQTVGGNGQK